MTHIVNGYNLEEIKANIRARGYRYDDKTPSGGCIWVSTGRSEAADGAFFREIELRTGAPFHTKPMAQNTLALAMLQLGGSTQSMSLAADIRDESNR